MDISPTEDGQKIALRPEIRRRPLALRFAIPLAVALTGIYGLGHAPTQLGGLKDDVRHPASTATTTEKPSDEFVHLNNINVFNPQHPLNIADLARKVVDSQGSIITIGQQLGLRAGPINLLNEYADSYATAISHKSGRADQDTSGITHHFAAEFVPFTPAQLDILQASLDLVPESLYKRGDKPASIYLFKGPMITDIWPDGKYLQATGRPIRVDDEPLIVDYIRFQGYCYCGIGMSSALRGKEGPSILLNRRFLEFRVVEEKEESLAAIAHELTHVKVESFTEDKSDGKFHNLLVDEALQILGIVPPENYGEQAPELVDKLTASGDVVKRFDPNGNRTTYEPRSKIAYLALGPVEVISGSTNLYLLGKPYFFKEFSRVFGEDEAQKYYEFIKAKIFDGREYKEGELRGIAVRLSPLSAPLRRRPILRQYQK